MVAELLPLKIEELDGKRPKMSSSAIVALLHLRHPSPAWSGYAELMAGTGFSNAQRIDYFAMHTWPSQAYRSIAYEIKVSRADFMREIQDPGKRAFAEKVASECCFATPAGLVRVDEVPEGWGLLEATKGGLRVRKAATQRKVESWPMSFTASLARRATRESGVSTSKTMWSYAGQELDEAALLKIAEETHDAYALRAKTAADEELRNKVRALEMRVRDLQLLENTVRKVTGLERPDWNSFERWATQHTDAALTESMRRRLENLQREIAELLASAV